MGDLDVLKKMPKPSFFDEVPEINSDEFEKVVQNRRSVRVYNSESIPAEVVEKCLENALLAPSSSNLQPWEFYWVRSKDKKEKLKEYCLSQLAATTAQELIVCVARLDRWPEVKDKILEELNKGGDKVSKGALVYYNKIVPFAYTQGWFGLIGLVKKIGFFFSGLKTPTPREPASSSDMRVWAHKSTALACENLMLSFRAYGYDSCPMEGMDSKRVRKLLNLPKKAEICMVISAGKRADNGVFGPRLRMPSEDFIFKV